MGTLLIGKRVENMTRTGIYAIICGLIYSAVIGYIAYSMGKNATQYAVDTFNHEVLAESVGSPVGEISEPEKREYLVKEFNNRIGVYQGEQLIRIIDVDVLGLRATDRERLREGIRLETGEDLAGFLEDYGS